MPLKLYKRRTRDGFIFHYRGTVDGCLLRGSTGTADRKTAAKIAAQIETQQYKGDLFTSKATLTFPQAVTLYLKAGKSDKYLGRIEDHWKNTRVNKMTAGAIRQSAIDIYPGCSGATWNRQVITPTQAVINHCAERELCPPIRVRRFKFEKKIKKPVTVEWLDTFCAHASPLNIALSTLMFATACRISEAMRVGWPDIDFTQRMVLIRDNKTKKERLAHMPPRLLVALANLPRDTAPFDLPETNLRIGWDADVARTIEAVPGFERLTFHSCRHGFATKMLRDGVDPKTAAKLGGWDDIGLFMETYAHAMPNARLTEGIFGTPATREESEPQQNQKVGENK